MRKFDFILTLIIISLLIIFDQTLKIAVENTISLGQEIKFIPGFIGLTKAYNTGMAWGMLGDSTLLLAIISTIASIICLYFCTKNNFKNNKLYSISLCMIVAGAVGNMIDRYLTVGGIYKGVIDMLQFKFVDFPIFNLADAFLVIGVILLAIYILFFEGKKENAKKVSNNE